MKVLWLLLLALVLVAACAKSPGDFLPKGQRCSEVLAVDASGRSTDYTTSIVYARYICHGYEVDASYACFFDGEGTVQNCSEILP